jgi:hypothetical protein
MIQSTNLPNPEKFKHGAEKLREACLLWLSRTYGDKLNL